MKSYNGPFGNYAAGSMGAVLNAMCEQEGRSCGVVDQYVIGNGAVYRSSSSKVVVATYVWDDEGNIKFDWK